VSKQIVVGRWVRLFAVLLRLAYLGVTNAV
jgi:hypothetical protein